MQPSKPRQGLTGILRDPATQRAIVVVVFAFVLVLGLFFIWYAAEVLLLAFAGILLAIFLRGLAEWLSAHTPLSSGWALAAVGTTLVGLLGLGAWLLAPQISEQFDRLGEQLPRALVEVRARIEQYSWGRQLFAQMPTADELASNQNGMLSQVTGFFSTTLGAVFDVVIVLFLGFYLATEPGLYVRGTLRLVPPARRGRASEVLQTLTYTLRWWLLGRSLSMIVVGVLTALGLWLLGIPLALTLGLLAALFDFVPNIGPLLAAAPAILLALGESPTRALYVAALYLVIQVAEGYLLTPLVEQRTVLIPPALTILFQVLLGVLLGGLGLVLASPLLAVALVLIKLLYVEDVLGDSIDVPGEPE